MVKRIRLDRWSGNGLAEGLIDMLVAEAGWFRPWLFVCRPR